MLINSDSQIVMKAVNKKTKVPKVIVNLVKDIKWLSSYFTEFLYWNIIVEIITRKLMK